MRRWFVPDRAVHRLVEIRPEELRARGIRGVVLDLDNTLLPPTAELPAPEIAAWVGALRKNGLRVVLLSNAWKSRIERVAASLGCEAIAGPPKPSLRRLRRALRHLGTAPAETASIGDQLLTDVLPANLLGLHTILVEPLDRREFAGTRLLRVLERLVGRDRIVRDAIEQESSVRTRSQDLDGRGPR